MGTETFAKITQLEVSVVRALARKLEPRAGGLFNCGDLESAGDTLLVNAALAYEPVHGVSFRSYASTYVLYGLLDMIRAEREVRRQADVELALAGHSAFDRGRADVHPASRSEVADAFASLQAALARLDPIDEALVRGFHMRCKESPLGAQRPQRPSSERATRRSQRRPDANLGPFRARSGAPVPPGLAARRRHRGSGWGSRLTNFHHAAPRRPPSRS